MTGQSSKLICMGALALGLAAPAWANTAGTPNLQAEIAALRAEVAELRSSQNESWLTERRAEEVRTLIHEVLADAETRSTLLQEGLLAGHDGKHFFLGSADGAFLMQVSGQIQVRFEADHQEGGRGTFGGRNDSQIDIRRTNLTFAGHIADPRIGYKVKLALGRTSDDVSFSATSFNQDRRNDVYAEDVVISYDLTDELTIAGGRYKLPFLRQFLMSSARQLAVDRAAVTGDFNVARADQISLTYQTDAFRATGAFSDGAGSDGTANFTETAEYALTGRVDAKLAGEWNDWNDLVSLQGDSLSAFVGAAVHYEAADGQKLSALDAADALLWTIDGSVKSNGFSLMGAVMGGQVNPEVGPTVNPLGVLVEGGYSITDKLQPFARWEWSDSDLPGAGDNEMVTVGANYFLNGHDAKFTTDLGWVYENENDNNDYLLFRAQFQLLF